MEVIDIMFDWFIPGLWRGLKFVYAHFWTLFAMALVSFNVRGIVAAFKGGNGHWQLDEVSKITLLLAVIFMLWTNGTHEHDWKHFSTELIILLLIVQIVQAKMDVVLEYFNNYIDKWKGNGS